MFVVVFKGRHARSLSEWKPNEEDEYVCGEATARFRFRQLVKAGERGEFVDGAIPWYVAILDVSGPDKSGKLLLVDRVDEPIAPDRRIRLVQYVDKFHTSAQGPWVHLAIAS